MRPIASPRRAAVAVAILLIGGAAAAVETTITVRADRTVCAIAPYMTGACIEDVNHGETSIKNDKWVTL
jgi:hypothetical protein